MDTQPDLQSRPLTQECPAPSLDRPALVLRSFGLKLQADPLPDGKIHRVPHCGGERSDEAGWYVYHPAPVPRLAFGCWRCHPEAQHWTDPEQRSSRSRSNQLEVRRANARRARDIERSRRNVAERTRHWLSQLPPAAATHPYLQRKGIRAHGALASDDLLVLPLQDASGHLWSAQLIAPAPHPGWSGRDKSFAPGGRVSGCFHAIGDLSSAPCIVVCEGFATGATIAEVTGLPVACALSAGNLAPVAEALTERFPNACLVIAADHDRHSPANPGVSAASAAGSRVNAVLAVPDFGEISPAADASDFNDLRRLRGPEAVRAAFERPPNSGSGHPQLRDRPVVRLPDAFGVEMPNFMDALGDALVDANAGRDSPRYLARAHSVTLLLGRGRLARLVPADEHVLRVELQRDVRFLQRHRDKDGSLRDSVAGTLPVALARDLARTPALASRLPVVDGVAGCPLLDATGTMTATGYAPSLQLVCACDPWTMDRPSLTQARDRLLDLLADFRFVTPADQARGLAALLQPALVLGGHVERGPALLVVADQPSTGKGTLVAQRSAVYGATSASITLRERGGVGSLDEDLSMLLAQGSLFVNIDNVRGGLRSQLLEACLTESLVSLRTPYRAAIAADPRKLNLSITSNGVSLTPDLSLRCNIVRLRKQAPGYRFRHRQPVTVATTRRAELLSAVFAILRDWIALGAPRLDQGFEGHARDFWCVVDEIIPRTFHLPCPTLGLKEAVLVGANAFLEFLRGLALILQSRNQIPSPAFTAAQLLRIAGDEGLAFDNRPIPIDDEHRVNSLAAVFGRRAAHQFQQGPVHIEDFRITQHREQAPRRPFDPGLGTFESKVYRFVYDSAALPATPAGAESQQWQQQDAGTLVDDRTRQEFLSSTPATAEIPPLEDEFSNGIAPIPCVPDPSEADCGPQGPDVVTGSASVTTPEWWRDFMEEWCAGGRDRTRHGVQTLLSRHDCTLERAVTAGWLEVTAHRVLLGPAFNQCAPRSRTQPAGLAAQPPPDSQ